MYFFIEFSVESHFISMQSIICFSDSAITTFSPFDSSLGCCSLFNSAWVCGAISNSDVINLEGMGNMQQV